LTRCTPVWALLLSACVVETAITDPDPSSPVSTVPVERIDRDEDGFTEAEGDCDDLDPLVGPEVAFSEVCDLVDNDCDGQVDDSGVCAERDRFEQRMQLDVLFVVDTSDGMQPYAQQAGRAAWQFAQHVVGPGMDSRLGVLTMSPGTNGAFPGLVEVGGLNSLDGQLHTEPGFVSRWLEQAIGENKVSETAPRARDAVLEHLDVVYEWDARSFLRTNVPLVVVFLSRVDDTSRESLGAFRDELDHVFDQAPTMHGIIRLGDAPCEGDKVGAYGESYAALAELSDGVTVDICTESFHTFFFVTGQLAADEGLDRRYYLDERVNHDRPLAVEVTLPSGFTELLSPDEYDVVEGGTVLVLQSPPPAGSAIVVDYQRLPAD